VTSAVPDAASTGDGSSARRRYFADLHCHTSRSFDSLSTPAAVARVAAQRGLTHLAITDHERIDGAHAARDAAPDGLSVIVGQEVRTRGGDLIGLFLEHPVPPGMSSVDAARAIREQGGVVGLPHPFDRFRSSGARRNPASAWQELLALVDYVEGYNARLIVGDGNARAAALAREHGLPTVAVSDAHTLMEVGVAYTAFETSPDSAAALREALAGARLTMGRGSRLVRAGMPVVKGIQWLRGNRRVRSA
jgi:predicted metal-dependent phosphoesterase TrpH